jgi:hypothetical protein
MPQSISPDLIETMMVLQHDIPEPRERAKAAFALIAHLDRQRESRAVSEYMDAVLVHGDSPDPQDWHELTHYLDSQPAGLRASEPLGSPPPDMLALPPLSRV